MPERVEPSLDPPVLLPSDLRRLALAFSSPRLPYSSPPSSTYLRTYLCRLDTIARPRHSLHPFATLAGRRQFQASLCS